MKPEPQVFFLRPGEFIGIRQTKVTKSGAFANIAAWHFNLFKT